MQDQNHPSQVENASGGRPASPCISICTLDASGTVCTGCHRRLDEIARWLTMSQGERDDIWQRLERARARAGAI